MSQHQNCDIYVAYAVEVLYDSALYINIRLTLTLRIFLLKIFNVYLAYVKNKSYVFLETPFT